MNKILQLALLSFVATVSGEEEIKTEEEWEG